MPDSLTDAPFLAIFAFFFTVAFLRTQATYWLARVVATQTLERAEPRNRVVARAQAWSTTDTAQRGVRIVHTWGVLAVPVSFCAFGTKTVVNAAAGLTRMPFGRYLPAMVVGCLAHATIYATVGWAAWTAALSAAAGSPWGVLALVVLVGLVVGAVVTLRRRRRARSVRLG